MFSTLTLNPVRVVFSLAAFGLLCTISAAFLVGNSVVVIAVTSLAFLGFGGLMARFQPSMVAIGAAIALIGQAMAFTAAFQGHPWQIDSHMMFFALLACLVCLRSIPALLVGASIIALHHVSLSFFMPSLIYPSGGFQENFGRTALHAVIVVVESAALVLAVHQIRLLHQQAETKNAELQDALSEAESTHEVALLAKTAAEESKQKAEVSQQEAENALAQVQEAEAVRQASESETNRLAEEQRDKDNAKAGEQAQVVNALSVALTALESGDLTARITDHLPKSYQGLAFSFNSAVEKLEEMVAQVAVRADRMDTEIQAVAQSTTSLAKRAEEQAKNLSGTSKALEGLTDSVVLNTQSVAEANQSSHSAKASAQVSGEVVTNASQAMEAIQTEAQEIAKIVELIEGISFQTNLLALNAGVEAARAGEAGLGFAVVATEVRALAQRSSESATSIRSLIERSAQQVENGSLHITETVNSLKEVESTISDITQKMEVISGSTQTQSDGISSLNTSIAQIGKETAHNAAMFEQASEAYAKLADGAKILRDLTARFRVSSSDSFSDKAA